MKKFTIEFYEKENGEIPIEKFLNSLDTKMRAKTLGLMDVLQDKGNELREPYSKNLGNGIFELRIKIASNITRILFFFYLNKRIIITNGFMKKTRKTPKSELQKAKKYRLNYIERCEKNEKI
jgi:phage-related protein